MTSSDKSRIHWLLLFPMLFVFGCSNSDNEDAVDTLLEQQEKNRELKKEIIQHERREERLSEKLHEEQVEDLQTEKEHLKSSLTRVNEALEKLQNELLGLNKEKEKLTKQAKHTALEKEDVKGHLQRSVRDLDFQLDELETKKRSLGSQISLHQEEIGISEKKIEAYEKEIELVETRKSNLLRERAGETAIKEVQDKLDGIEKNLNSEQNKIKEANLAIDKAKKSVRSTTEKISSLTKAIEKEHKKKGVVGEFIKDKKESIEEAIRKIEANESRLFDEQGTLVAEQQKVKEKLEKLEVQISPVADQPLKHSQQDLEGNDVSLGAKTVPRPSEKSVQPPTREDGFGATGIIIILVLVALILLTFYFVGKRSKAKAE